MIKQSKKSSDVLPRGGTVEAVGAHQALDRRHFDYYRALSRRAKALVALEAAAGIWDVDF